MSLFKLSSQTFVSCTAYLFTAFTLVLNGNIAHAHSANDSSSYEDNGSSCFLKKGNKLPKGLAFHPSECDSMYRIYESNDLLPVVNTKKGAKNQGKYGFVNRHGKLVINTLYDDVLGFSGDLAAVKLNGKWGYIDHHNNVVIPIQYDMAQSFSHDRAIVDKNGKQTYIDVKGHPISNFIYDCTVSFGNNGLATVGIYTGSSKEINCYDNIKWGSINKQGTVVIPIIYDKIADCVAEGCEGFVNGHVIVAKQDGVDENGNKKYLNGLVNEQGEVVVPLVYDTMYHRPNGSIFVQKDGKQAIINNKHQILINFTDNMLPFDSSMPNN